MQALVMDGDGLFRNIAVGTVMIFAVLVTLVALHLAEQANSRANRLSAQVSAQQEMLNTQDRTMGQILTMSGVHQDLIEGILDNQAGIVKLVTKRAKQTRKIASANP